MAGNKRSSDHNHNNNARDSKSRRNVEPPRTTPETERGLTHSPYFKGPLYERMSEDLHLGGMSKRTHEGYLRAVRQLADFCQKTPDQISEDQLRKFFLHLKNDKSFASGSLRVAFSGVKFFYTRTCRRNWQTLAQMKIKNVKSLPEVLTIDQVHQIIDACTTQRMMIHVHRGKDANDRYIPLPESTLLLLRQFWATHRLEAGVSLRQIQQFLGHSSLQTTMVYLHLTDTQVADARRVVDELFRRPR